MTTPSPQEIDAFWAYHRRRDETQRREREDLRLDLLGKVRGVIRRLAPEFSSVREVHIFGSILQPGRFTRGSDIDLAVEIDDLEQEGPFARALEQVLEWRVDLRPHTGPIRRAVDTSGETVYAREDSGS